MLIAEYDYDTDIKIQRQESFEEGAMYGIAQGVAQQKAKDEKLLRQTVEQKDAEIEKLKSQLAKALGK